MVLRPKFNELYQRFEYGLVGFYQVKIPYGAIRGNLGRLIHIPTGFGFDGATIPRWAWGWLYSPFDPQVMVAAAAHDWLYLTHETTRKEADQTFYYLLRENKVPRWKAFAMYLGVRIGGWRGWFNGPKETHYLKELGIDASENNNQ